MNSKIVRKRRTDRNQVIYYIQDVVTQEYYIGLTAMCFAGNVRKTLARRMQKHMQRALTENKNWGLSRGLGDVYKRQSLTNLISASGCPSAFIFASTSAKRIL